ncbi:MAG: 23S rRNA (guanosine(2251)-2'-O)-methyltransferase RlmB [Deltaproteobacteria bacterium]|nr:23S rRNA (guanosine(2251)-2'-O)-methyltransferase RlmB [Deltaproteobacteria bacterium]
MKGPRDVNARRGAPSPAGPRWVFGVNAVERRLSVQPGSVREVRLAGPASPRRNTVAALARAAGVAVRECDAAEMRRMTGSEEHQGVAALVAPFAYADLEVVVGADPGPLLLLDQIQDPHNLGALVRTAAAVGVAAVVIPRHGAAGVTAAVEKVAAGAVNDVPICQVANLHRTLLDLRELGYWSIALVPRGGVDLFTIDLPERPALVLGGEGGIRPLVASTCDFLASIPQRSGVESLNASVAGAVAMYEVARRLRRLDRL